MSLSQQLTDALKNQHRPLNDRLEIAHKVFSSSSIPIALKEDAILCFIGGLLTSLVKEKNDCADGSLTQIVDCLAKCLESDKRRSYSWDLRPETAETILKVLPEVVAVESTSGSTVFNCSLRLLSAPRFHRWLSCDVALLCNFLGNLLHLCSSGSSSLPPVESLINILEEFLQIYRASSFKEEGQMGFIREVVFPLGQAVSVYNDSQLTSTAVNCVNAVVFFSRQVLGPFWDLMRLEKPSVKSSNPLEVLVARLKCLPSQADPPTVSSMFCLVIRASAIKLLDSPKGVKLEVSLEKRQKDMFEMFILLSQPLGITVDKKVSISLSPVENWTANGSYAVIRDMIEALDKIGLPLNLEFEGFTLNSWLISLVVGMASINLTELSMPLLEMINSAYTFNPLVIEPSLRVVGHIMARKKPAESSEAYVQLMKTVFQGVASVQRLQKTLSLLLANIQESMSQHLDDDLTLNDILPEELGLLLSHLLEALPSSQILSTFRAFLFHFERDCLNLIEAGCTDSKVVICTEFIGDLLSRLIFSAKVADHSVPDEIKAKFSNIFEDMKITLGKMASACQENHHDRLLRAFLKMCYACGELHLMIEKYEGAPIKRLEKCDLNPVNFNYVHSYASTSWEKIGTGILEHETCLAKTELLAMMVQKARAVARAEEGTQCPSTMVARLILKSARVSWMWSELLSLASIFQAEELVRLVKKLVCDAGDDQSSWKPFLDCDDFLENRCLVLATALMLLYVAAKRINKPSFTYKNMSNLKFDVLLEYELSQMITEDDDLADEVKLSTKSMASALEGKLLLTPPLVNSLPDKSFFVSLHRLPVHHFSVSTQSCLLLSILSLLWELPPKKDVDFLLLDVLYQILSGAKKNSRALLSGLNPGVLLEFLAHRAADYSERTRLLKSLCFVALNDVTSSKRLIKQVYKFDRDLLWLKTLVIFALTQTKKKTVFKETEGDDDDEDDVDEEDGEEDSDDDGVSKEELIDRHHCIEMLLKEITPVLESEDPSDELAQPFYLFLRHRIRDKSYNSPESKSVMKKLPNFLDIELKSSSDSRLMETLIKHRSDLGNLVPSTIISDAWQKILNSPSSHQEPLVNLVFTSSNTQEFQLMLLDLHHETNVASCQLSDNSGRFESLVRLWGLLVTCFPSYEKSRLRSEVLKNLTEPLTKVIASWHCCASTVKPVLEFFINLIESTSVKSVLIDCCFVALETVPLPVDDVEVALERFVLGVNALFALIHFRGPLISDRLPVYLLSYRYYLSYIATVGSPDCALPAKVAHCANNLERLTKEMVKRKKDMARVAQYLVADILCLMEKHPLHYEVKISFSNIIYDFMSLFDKHSSSFISTALPPSTQELFKTVFRDFNKYHKYTGKI